MSVHPYLIHLDDPKDWLAVNNDIDPETGAVIEEQHDILWPEGADQMYEFNDSKFFLSTSYHEHKTGWETFFIHKGRLDLYTNGQVTEVGPEDIIFIPPYTPHKMVMLDPPTIWNGMFHGIGMLTTLNNWARILKNVPDMLQDPEVKANYLGNPNNILRENPNYAERVSKYDMRAVRPYDKPLVKFDFPGVSMRQYTNRGENNGTTELWLAEMKKGFRVDYKHANSNVDLFYIIEGTVHFNVAGEEFDAVARDLVKVPHFAPRAFEAVTDARMYDAGGSTHWFDVFDDMRTLKMLDQAKYNDKAYVDGVLARHECMLKSVYYGDQKVFER